MNFIPKRPEADILAEWQRAIVHLYKPENYLARAFQFILDMRPTRSFLAAQNRQPGLGKKKEWIAKRSSQNLRGTAMLFWRQGIKAPYRRQFWRQLWVIWRRNPSRLNKYLSLCSLGENVFAVRERVSRGLTGGMVNSINQAD